MKVRREEKRYKGIITHIFIDDSMSLPVYITPLTKKDIINRRLRKKKRREFKGFKASGSCTISNVDISKLRGFIEEGR